MIDKYGFSPTDDGYFVVNDSWIYVGKTAEGWSLYQKTASGLTLPIVKATREYVQAPHYKAWREQTEGKPWSEIAKQYDGVRK